MFFESGEKELLLKKKKLMSFLNVDMPVLGEWFAVSMIEAVGSREISKTIFSITRHPIAVKLIRHYDAVLRIDGALIRV